MVLVALKVTQGRGALPSSPPGGETSRGRQISEPRVSSQGHGSPSAQIQLSQVPLASSSSSTSSSVKLGVMRNWFEITTSYKEQWVSLIAQPERTHLQSRRHRLHPCIRKIPWMGWLPTPVFLPGKSLGQRSLVGHSLCGRKKSDMT